jgi:hypothetical protein
MSATRMTCRDCGERYQTERDRGRTDVCDPCLETRTLLVEGAIVDVTSLEFRMIQKKLAAGRGTAKRYIDSLRRHP